MSQPFVGECRMVGFNFAPQGWAMCAGQVLAISENPTLFNLIGTTYGGDGQTTFQLPDLRGRVPIHQGTGPGMSFSLGAPGGAENVTLVTGQLPTHNHALVGTEMPLPYTPIPVTPASWALSCERTSRLPHDSWRSMPCPRTAGRSALASLSVDVIRTRAEVPFTSEV